ncbi:hypothetical protein Glove_508g71 [Diversispora epigaea]|uniref:Histone-lysine N-methyltransferase SET5 n=1 Tax=Diversispora epigaea TaxID=1348612 RepID=A0A397GHP9_9GLOM|nr:hypothetical protein Glove_508g71 [Diversispora epigaea]
MQNKDHRTKGNEAIKQNNYLKAWKEYTRALIKDSRNPILWCNRSLACLKGGWPELALVDTVKAEELCISDVNKLNNDVELQKLLFKSRYRYAEAMAALGIPILAGRAYHLLLKEFEFYSIVSDSDRKLCNVKGDIYLQLANVQRSVLREQANEDKIIITNEGSGWYKFKGNYPWDCRLHNRLSREFLEKMQKSLNFASQNKLEIKEVSFYEDNNNNYIDQSQINNNKFKELGIVAKQDISDGEFLLEEDPFITVHNHDQLRCDFCFHKLTESSNDSKYPVKFPCLNSECKEFFCDSKCYNSAMNLYHQQLCGKNIDNLIKYAQNDLDGINLLVLFALKLFAIAKNRNICPLDIDEIKHLSRNSTHPRIYNDHNIFGSDIEFAYTEILKVLNISLFDLRYDFWVFITILALVEPNAFEGPPKHEDPEISPETAALFSLSSLLNHNCDPNTFHFEALSESYIFDDQHTMKFWRMVYKEKGSHSFRMFVISNKAIKKGEEIFFSYVDENQSKFRRQGNLLITFRFECNCNRCKVEIGKYVQKPVAWNLYYLENE